MNDDSYKNKDSVENGCGFCHSELCDMHSMLGCLLCKHFVTMPNRLPYFEEYIKELDNKISNATIKHDIDDYHNIKRLLVAYMTRLVEMEEQ